MTRWVYLSLLIVCSATFAVRGHCDKSDWGIAQQYGQTPWVSVHRVLE